MTHIGPLSICLSGRGSESYLADMIADVGAAADPRWEITICVAGDGLSADAVRDLQARRALVETLFVDEDSDLTVAAGHAFRLARGEFILAPRLCDSLDFGTAAAAIDALRGQPGAAALIGSPSPESDAWSDARLLTDRTELPQVIGRLELCWPPMVRRDRMQPGAVARPDCTGVWRSILSYVERGGIWLWPSTLRRSAAEAWWDPTRLGDGVYHGASAADWETTFGQIGTFDQAASFVYARKSDALLAGSDECAKSGRWAHAWELRMRAAAAGRLPRPAFLAWARANARSIMLDIALIGTKTLPDLTALVVEDDPAAIAVAHDLAEALGGRPLERVPGQDLAMRAYAPGEYWICRLTETRSGLFHRADLHPEFVLSVEALAAGVATYEIPTHQIIDSISL